MAAATRSAAQEPSSTAIKQDLPAAASDSQDKKSSPRTEKAAAPKQEPTAEDSKSNPPLAPPSNPAPKPAFVQVSDLYSGAHSNSHFSLEPNPFEQSFGNPSTAETPGKFGGLPSVASLTSPAPIGPGGTPGWQNSLRSGPLSPAMLTGPTTSNGAGYFDQEFRGSFPTPNESSLRTGLTPGGGSSMFPAPSPNSQAIFNSMQTGGATPGTLDFHRTAMSAAARSKVDNPPPGNNNMNSSSQPVNKQEYQPAQQHSNSSGDPFNAPSQPESDAVNSLYMLANNNRNNNQFAVPNQPAHTANMQQRMTNGQDTSHRASKGSIGAMSMSSNGDSAEYDSESGSIDGKTPARSKGRKGSGAKATPSSNGRRKAEEQAGRGSASKRAKNESDDEMGADMGPSGKSKMTDEEKRKNFLERNRVAALKCRQRKKQWLANLQTKVEIFSSENDALTAQCAQMRDEIIHLKSLLYAHKDCPISHQQGLGGNNMANVMGNFDPNQPYMGMPNGQQMMAAQNGQGMQRN